MSCCCTVIMLALVVVCVTDFPIFIGKVLCNLLKCLVAFQRMRDMPVRKTDDFKVSI